MLTEEQQAAAFVVQFHSEANLEAGQYSGRVEHIASGRFSHFHSTDELVAFLTRLLAAASRSQRSNDRESSDGE